MGCQYEYEPRVLVFCSFRRLLLSVRQAGYGPFTSSIISAISRQRGSSSIRVRISNSWTALPPHTGRMDPACLQAGRWGCSRADRISTESWLIRPSERGHPASDAEWAWINTKRPDSASLRAATCGICYSCQFDGDSGCMWAYYAQLAAWTLFELAHLSVYGYMCRCMSKDFRMEPPGNVDDTIGQLARLCLDCCETRIWNRCRYS
jgi:hypothetical protein